MENCMRLNDISELTFTDALAYLNLSYSKILAMEDLIIISQYRPIGSNIHNAYVCVCPWGNI
jgi:hypothetical protein